MRADEFFLKTKRLASNSEIAIVRGDKFEEFVQYIVEHGDMDRAFKAFLVVCLSAGLRVSEGLSLTKESFVEDGGDLYFKVSVLKKRDKKEQRYGRVHPLAVSLIKDHIENQVGKLFDFTDRTALRRVQSYFPGVPVVMHSFRHSAVSYFLFEKNLSTEKTAKLIHISSKIVDTYAHLDERKVLKNLF